MKKIDIVIVTYNSKEYIADLLTSIKNQSEFLNNLIISDNGSSDLTLELIAQKFPEAVIIRNGENLGFCAAVNKGIDKSTSAFVMVLNSDTFLADNCLKNVSTAIKINQNHKVGMLAPKLIRFDKATIDSTGLHLSYLFRFYDRGSKDQDRGQYDHLIDIFAPCGACAVYDRNMLNEIKFGNEYFDESFFFLGEDFDLGWRAIHKGWKALYIPTAVCFHKRNSTGFNEKFRQYLSFRNRYYLLIKNCPLSIRLFITLLLYDLPRLLYMMFFNNSFFRKALSDILNRRQEMLEKRRNILSA